MPSSEEPSRSLWPLILGFVILLCTATALAGVAIAQHTSASLVRKALETENRLNSVLTLVADAETGQRGYLLTGRDAYLGPYDTARRDLLASIDALAAQTADDPVMRSGAAELRLAAAAKLAELQSTITARQAGTPDTALAIVNSDDGLKIMARIRDTVATMRAHEQAALAENTAFTDLLARLSQLGSLFTALAIVALAVYALRDGRKRLLVLQATNRQLAREIAERKSAVGQVRQLQKMEAVGQLTGGIAHDFNNMLAVIIGSLDVARRRLLGTEHRSILGSINNAMEGAERAAMLTSRLLAFSRQQPLEPKVLDVNSLVAGMSQLLRRTIGEAVEVETVLAGGLWRTHADAAQLESALVNLAVNARDAMPSGGRLTIETANTYLDDAYAAAHVDVPAGQYVMVSVTDTGTGMSAEVIERAFDPFYTTKEVGKGTGLGLSQVFGFVRQSGGHVKIYSEMGHGTTVKVYLPRHLGNVVETGAPAATDSVPTANGAEIVLVVEDEVQVRRVTVDALEDLGYSVIQAAGPSEAMVQLARHPNIGLLLTDIVMPEMNGRKLAEQAVALRPSLKVIYMTGYTRNAVVHNGVLDAGVAFLPKPFSIAQLATKVRQVLDS